MKKKIIAVILMCMIASSCMSLSGCNSTSDNEYYSKYDFYADSVDMLKKKMDLEESEATDVFGVLIEIGLDENINACTLLDDMYGDEYYAVGWGTDYAKVYLKADSVDRIIKDDFVVYENGSVVSYKETIKKTTEPPTEAIFESTTEKPTTEISPTEKPAKTSTTNENSDNNFQTYDNEEQQNTVEYVLNTKTKKVHRATCSSVKKISPENYATISNLEDAYNQGYEACKKCNP